MIHLKLSIPDMDYANLNPDFYPYIDWNKLRDTEISLMPKDVILYAPIRKIISHLSTQEKSGVSDTQVLEVIARCFNELNEKKHLFSRDVDLFNFINEFCSFEFRKKYHRQLLAKRHPEHTYQFVCTLVADYIVGLEFLDKLPYHKMTIDVFNKLKLEDMRKLIFNTNYIQNTLTYQVQMDEAAFALPSSDLEKLKMPVPKNVMFTKTLQKLCTSEQFSVVVKQQEEINWDEMVDLYHKGEIVYSDLFLVWKNFIEESNEDYIRDSEEFVSESINNNFDRSYFNIKDYL
ncbi:hypothetical protein BZF66_05605 [Salmonella enterica]|uniref:hypothetical protein n=1 Tax=Salmonella enterica TaxID=28901 RepID=UPI000FDF9418|nr:hypothetical protein CPT_Munch_496 [Salmonella phage Munch]EAZ2022767.1 hypothetical protein [Salmonella enterica]ECV9083901.1 hypothetical protein [Salmonella enterica subsp. enterica serovar Infantis]MCP0435502.1 hypothetical protein [Salmonella enterica subsp. enterica serovar Mbandaka]ELL7856346.1 hypothetical protein [Salmonella enterica]